MYIKISGGKKRKEKKRKEKKRKEKKRNDYEPEVQYSILRLQPG